MKFSIGSDHAGFELKKVIFEYLKSLGHTVYDEGTYSTDSVDYPDYAAIVAKKVQNHEVDFGILICYTGIGMSITANKFKGVRASLVGLEEDAVLTREHNNSNILCLSAKNTKAEDAKQIVKAYFESSFIGGRHERRVNKICAIEDEER